MVDGYGLAGLPDVSEDDWNAYTADQFSTAINPLQESLRFQELTAGATDPIAQVMATPVTPAAPVGQGLAPSTPSPYDELRYQMMAPDTDQVQVGNGMPPMGPMPSVQTSPAPQMGPPGPPQPGFWEGTDPSKPNVFSWAGQGLQQGVDEMRRSGVTQTPVVGGILGGLGQAGANALNNLGGTAQALRQGDIGGAAGGVLQATVGANTPLGWGKDILTEQQAPTQILPFIDPETPVIGGLNNPRELAGIIPQLLAPETFLERAVGRGVIEPVGRAALKPVGEALGRAGEALFGQPEPAVAGVRAGGIRYPGRVLTREGADRINALAAEEAENPPTFLGQPMEGLRSLEPEPIPVYFSKLGRAIENLPQERMTVGQAHSGLLKQGVKPEEMRWTGLEDTLTSMPGNAPITKTDLRNIFESGEVGMRETIYENTPGTPEYEQAKAAFDLANMRYQEAHNRMVEVNERLMRGDRSVENEAMAATQEALKATYARNDARRLLQSQPDPIQDPNAPAARYPLYVQHTAAQQAAWDRGINPPESKPGYREIVLHPYGGRVDTRKPFRTTHFPHVVNPTMHLRVSDRTTPDGKRVLHVEEVQSDWHEQGRKHGYRPDRSAAEKLIPEARGYWNEVGRLEDMFHDYQSQVHGDRRSIMEQLHAMPDAATDPRSTALAARLREIVQNESALSQELMRVTNEANAWEAASEENAMASAVARVEHETARLRYAEQKTIDTDFGTPEYDYWKQQERHALMARDIAEQTLQNRMSGGLSELPPRGPFEKTQAWTALGMKRVLRMAAEEGYDALSWTPARVHGERYGNQMGNAFEHIEYDPLMQELGLVYRGQGGGFHSIQNVSPQNLPEYIGQGATDALLAREWQPSQYLRNADNSDFVNVHLLSGDDLRESFSVPEGFTLQYEKAVPQAMRDILKPWKARDYMGEIELAPGSPERSAAHLVDITPEMRSHITQEGFSLFAGPKMPVDGVDGQARQIPLDQPLPPPPGGRVPPGERGPSFGGIYGDYWKNRRYIPAARRTVGGATLGTVGGGLYGYNTAPEGASEEERLARSKAFAAAGAVGLGAGGGLSPFYGRSALLKLAERGIVNPDVVSSHPGAANRIRALMLAAADKTPDGEVVRVPGLVNALRKLEGDDAWVLREPGIMELLTGQNTPEMVRGLVEPYQGEIDATIQGFVADLIQGMPLRRMRSAEYGADTGVAGRDLSQFASRNMRKMVNDIAAAYGLPAPDFHYYGSGEMFVHFGGKGNKPAVYISPDMVQNGGFTPDELADLIGHEMGHVAQEWERRAAGEFRGQGYGATPNSGTPGVPDPMKPDEDPLPPPETAGDALDRVINELTPEGRARIQEVGQLGAQRAPWLGEALERSEQPPPEGQARYDDIMRIADPEAVAPPGGAVGDALDEAEGAPAYAPPHKFDKRERERLGNARILQNLPEAQRQMAEQANKAMEQELMQAHGFRSETDAKAAAERLVPYMLQFARRAKPNEPVNEVLLRAARDAWAQSIFPAYFAEIDRWKMLNSTDFGSLGPEGRAAYEQAVNYWNAVRQVLGRYAGEIAPSEAGRTFRSMQDLPTPVMKSVAGGAPDEVGEVAAEAAPGMNKAAKTPKERAYEDMMRAFRTARRGEQQAETAAERGARRSQARVAGKKPNGPLSNMGIEWADVMRRTGNDDADRMHLLAGLEELGGYRMRRDWLDRAMKLDLSDEKAVNDFWAAARKHVGVDENMVPFVKFNPNVSEQSYLGGADTITKSQALAMVSKELIKDADEAHAAARQARSEGAPASEVRTLEQRAQAAFERLGLNISRWNEDHLAILTRAAESVRDRIAKDWPADRVAREGQKGAEEAVEKKRQLLGIFDQELKRQQRLAGIPVTGLQDLMSFGTSNVLMTNRFVQASILESALSAINEPLQSFLRGRYGEGMQQLRGLGRAFGLPTSEDLAALGEGVKAPAITNALRGLRDIGPMEAAGEMRQVAKKGAGLIRSDSQSKLARYASPMHRVSRGISEAFQTGNYFAEVNRLAHETARTGKLPGGRRIEQFVDDATGETRLPTVRELFGNLPQEIVDAALEKSRLVNEGGAAGAIEGQIGKWKALLNKPDATTAERTTGLFANLMFPFVYGLRPAIRAGEEVLKSPVKYPIEIARALRAGDTEEAKYVTKKLALAQSFNAFLAYNVLSGNITGHGPTDPATRQALMEATDENGDPIWRPDSYRIPNPGGGHTWVKYGSLPGPVSMVSTIMANMYEAYTYDGKDMEMDPERAARVAATIGASYLDNTYFRDMINLVEAMNVQGGVPNLGRIAGQIAGRFVPGAGALRTAATITDPYQRITENIGQDLASGIPGARQQLPAQVSAYTGRAVEQPLNPLTALGGIAGNIYASPSERNPVAREAAALSARDLSGFRPSEGVEGSVFPRAFTRGEQSRGAEFAGMRQTGEGIRGAQAAYGAQAEADLLPLLNSPAYQALSPQQKAQRIAQEVERTRGRGEYAAEGAPGITLPPKQALERRVLQTPQYYGVTGTPDQIAQQNTDITAAVNALEQLTTRYGRNIAMALLSQQNPEAFRLAMLYGRRRIDPNMRWYQQRDLAQEVGYTPEDTGVYVPDFGSGSDVIGGGTPVGAGLFDRRQLPPSLRR